MGQTASSKLSEEVRCRLRSLQVDEVLNDDVLLRRATTAVTAAFTHYRFRLKALRESVEDSSRSSACCLGGIRFWDSGVQVVLDGATTESETSCSCPTLQADGVLNDGTSDGGWTGKVLVITFPEPRAVTEFAFQTHSRERRQDPIRFSLDGSADGSKWLVLCDQTKSDFDTPNLRGVWTRQIELHDPSVDKGLVGARAAAKLSSVAEEVGAQNLTLWISGEPPRAPVQEAAALMGCCEAQLVGTERLRRRVFFSMLYAACESAWEDDNAAMALIEQTMSPPVEPLAALTSISIRCMVQVLLAPGIASSQAELILNMVNTEVEKGMRGVEWPVRPEDLPDALRTGLTAASDVLIAALEKSHAQSVLIAELLLRSAVLRAHWSDVLIIVFWLCQLEEIDVSRLWTVAECLHQVLSPHSVEILHGGIWQKDKVASRSAERSPVTISSSQLKALGDGGAYAEIGLVADALACRISLVPCVIDGTPPTWEKISLENGIAFEGGKTYLNGALLETRAPMPKPLKHGDTIGLQLLKDGTVTLSVNGESCGTLPPCAQFESAGCCLVISKLSEKSKVAVNVGVAPFKFALASARAWAQAGGVEAFYDLASRARERTKDECEALALVLLEALCHRTPVAFKKKVELTFESPHPYLDDTHEVKEVSIPGARTMNILFSPQCRSETDCDYMVIANTESAAASSSGTRLTGNTWTNKEIQGDSFWYLWHTDSSSTDWGWKFTVEAEVLVTSGEKFKQAVEADKISIDVLVSVMNSAKSVELIAGALNCTPLHVRLAKHLPVSTLQCLLDALVKLLRRKDKIGAQSAEILGTNAGHLFQSPLQLLKVLIQVWESEDEFHPDAVEIIGAKYLKMPHLFGKLVEDPEAWKVVDKFCTILVQDCTSERTARVCQLLWRALSDGACYVLAGRSAQPQEAWKRLFATVQEIVTLGGYMVAHIRSGKSEKPPAFFSSLLVPLLYGIAAIPQFNSAAWADVVSLLPPTCILVDGSRGTLPNLHDAAMELVAALGHATVRAGYQEKVAESDDGGIAEALKSPLFRGIPRSLSDGVLFARPLGVKVVDGAVRMDLAGEDGHPRTLAPALQEIVDGTSERIGAMVDRLVKCSKAKGKQVNHNLSPRIHRLIFCLMAKQKRCLDSISVLLPQEETRYSVDGSAYTLSQFIEYFGDFDGQRIWDSAKQAEKADDQSKHKESDKEAAFEVIFHLWCLAHDFELWLFSIKQRLVASGMNSGVVLEMIERILGFLSTCDSEMLKFEPSKDRSLSDVYFQLSHDETFAQQPPVTHEPVEHSKGIAKLKGWVEKAKQLKDLLLQTRNVQSQKDPAQHLRELFSAAWLRKDDPFGSLVSRVDTATSATWWRAAGLSVLAWAVEHCSSGADASISAVVVGKLADAWRRDSVMPRYGVEASALTALTGARIRAARAMTGIACADDHGDKVLQIMGLSWLAGPWLESDHVVIAAAGVLDKLRVYLPWAASSGANQLTRAAWLCVQSLASLRISSGTSTTPLSRDILAALLDALPKSIQHLASAGLKRTAGTWSPGAPPPNSSLTPSDELCGAGSPTCCSTSASGSSSLVALFFSKSTKSKNSKKVLEGLLQDVRERRNDFAIPDDDEDDWDDWFMELEETFRKWSDKFSGHALPEQLSESSVDPADFDFNGDGVIDCYEYFHLLHQCAQMDATAVPPWASKKWQLPSGFPRYHGDVGGVTEGSQPFKSIDDIPVPPIVKSPEFALLRVMDDIARTQQVSAFFGQQHIESLVQIAVDPQKAVPVALGALRLLRRLTDLPAPLLQSASRGILAALSAEPNAPIAAQRADLLRAWMLETTSRNVVTAILSEAFQAPDAYALAALRVIGNSPGLHVLSPTSGPQSDHSLVLAVSSAGLGDTSVTLFCEGTGSIEEVAATSLQLLPERCTPSCFSVDEQREAVDTVLRFRKDQAWALVTLLLESDAAEHFVGNGHLATWLPVALGEEMALMSSLTPSQRSNISAILRLEREELYTKYAVKAEDCEEGPQSVQKAPLDPYDVEVTTHEHPLMKFDNGSTAWVCDEQCENCTREADGATVRWRCRQCDYDLCRACMQSAQKIRPKGGLIVAAAARALGAPPSTDFSALSGTDLPELSQMLEVAQSCLANPPGSRIPRLAAVKLGVAESSGNSKEDDMCGLISAVKNPASTNSGQAEKLLKEARDESQKLDSLIWDAVRWDRQALALEVCFSSIHHIVAKEDGALDLAPPDQLVDLCLAFNKNLETDAAKSQARSEMLALAKRVPDMISVIADRSLAHLLGSLGEGRPNTVAGTPRIFESPHPYLNDTDYEEFVHIPGAQRLIVRFDPQCCTEEDCDYCCFQAESIMVDDETTQEVQRSGSGGDWEDLIIKGDHVTFKFVSDSSSTDWGYKFDIVPIMLSEATNAGKCILAEGLWLLDFLLDLLEVDGGPALALRPEVAGVLLAHAQRCFDERLSVLIQKFVNACKSFEVSLDWSEAQHMLKSLMREAQDSQKQSILQRVMALRLALPDVQVATLAPRFECMGTGAILSNGGRVCLANVQRDVYCVLNKRTMSACFKQFAAEKEAWVGVIAEVDNSAEDDAQREVQEDRVFMVSLKDRTLQKGSKETMSEISSDYASEPFEEMHVYLDVAASEVTFSATGFSRTLQLPATVSKGWRLAARLCEFGSSVGVDTPTLLDNPAVEKLQSATNAVKSVHMCLGDWPEEFLVDAFSEWCQNEQLEEEDATVSATDWGALQSGQLLVWGAGLPEYNGVYRNASGTYRNGTGCQIERINGTWKFRPISKNDELNSTETTVTFQPGPIGLTQIGGVVTDVDEGGQARREGVEADWRIKAVDGQTCEDFDDDGFQTAKRGNKQYQVRFARASDVKYAATLGVSHEYKSAPEHDVPCDAESLNGPCVAVAKNAGAPPKVCNASGPEKMQVMAKFDPPLISLPPTTQGDLGLPQVSVMEVFEAGEGNLGGLSASITLATIRCDNMTKVSPSMLSCTSGGTYKTVPGMEFRSAGNMGWVFCHTLEWQSEGKELFFCGGEGYTKVALCRSDKTKAVWQRLSSHCAEVVESAHPLSAGGVTKLKVSIPGAKGLSLQLGPNSELSAQTLMLVTLDEAGKQPAQLQQDEADASWKAQEKCDAARGMLSVVKGRKFVVNVGECFLHFPVQRLARWEPHGDAGNNDGCGDHDVAAESVSDYDFSAAFDLFASPDKILPCETQSSPSNRKASTDCLSGKFVPSSDGLLLFQGEDVKDTESAASEKRTQNASANEDSEEECIAAPDEELESDAVPDEQDEESDSDEKRAKPRPRQPVRRHRPRGGRSFGTRQRHRANRSARGHTTGSHTKTGMNNQMDKDEEDGDSDDDGDEKQVDTDEDSEIELNEEANEEADQGGDKELKRDEEADEDAEEEADQNADGTNVNILPDVSIEAPKASKDAEENVSSSDLPIARLRRSASVPLSGPAPKLVRTNSLPGKLPAPGSRLSARGCSDEAAVDESLAGPFSVRRSFSAMNWLQPGVLAGEVSVDFMAAPLTAGDLAIGVVGVGYFPGDSILQWQACDDSPSDGQWWWRCDGTSRTHKDANRKDASATFGAGDVIGIVALLAGDCLKLLEVLRNGSRIATWKPEKTDEVKLIQGDAPAALALCAACRRTSTSLSLLPSPQLMLKGLVSSSVPALSRAISDHLTESANKWLDPKEEALLIPGVFAALDEDGDGILSHSEISSVLGTARSELLEALDKNDNDQVTLEEWNAFCGKLKTTSGAIGLALFLDAFRKRLTYLGRAVAAPSSSSGEEMWGIHVTASPLDVLPETKIRLAKEVMPMEWSKFMSLAVDVWNWDLDVQLVKMINWLITEKFPNFSSVTQLPLMGRHELRAHQAEWQKKFPLLEVSRSQLESRFIVIRLLNMWIHDRMLPFCDLGNIQKVEFGRALLASRTCFLQPLKMERFNQIIEDTNTSSSKEIVLNRMVSVEYKEHDECDDLGSKTLFGQASKAADGIGVTLRSTETPLKISYAGEDGIDAGGLYRDFLDNCALELTSSSLPVLRPTPNNRSNSGDCREAWQVSPKPLTQATRRLFSFLGQLMGICIRRGDVLPLALSQLTWKLLVGEEPRLEDLALEDVATATTVENFLNIEALGVTSEDFESCFGDMRFAFHNSAGEEVPLGKRGKAKKVTFKNAKKFADLVLNMRLHEAAEQIECIRSGMALVVPIGCLSLWSWRDLEMAVCGNPHIDVALLRKHANYEDGYEAGSVPVKLLWEALESFSQEELGCFLRFVWGRSRLPPPGSKHWEDGGFKVTKAEQLGPDALPRAHTCFFQLELPPYNSGRVATEKILYAVKNCTDVQNE